MQTDGVFRWFLIAVPLALLTLSWLARGIHPARSWGQIMDLCQIGNRSAFTQLAALGCLITLGIVIARIARAGSDK